MKFSGVTILQGIEFSIFPIDFEWALQQCSATALPVITSYLHRLYAQHRFQELLGRCRIFHPCSFGPVFSTSAVSVPQGPVSIFHRLHFSPAFSSPVFSELAFLAVPHFPFQNFQSTHAYKKYKRGCGLDGHHVMWPPSSKYSVRRF